MTLFTIVTIAILSFVAYQYFSSKNNPVSVQDLSPAAEKWKTILTQVLSALLIIAGFGSIGQVELVGKLLNGMGYVVDNFETGYETVIRAIDLVVGLGLMFGIGKKKEEEVIVIQSMLK